MAFICHCATTQSSVQALPDFSAPEDLGGPAASGVVAGAAVGSRPGLQPPRGGPRGTSIGVPGTVALVVGFVTVLAAVAAVFVLCGAKRRAANREEPRVHKVRTRTCAGTLPFQG